MAMMRWTCLCLVLVSRTISASPLKADVYIPQLHGGLTVSRLDVEGPRAEPSELQVVDTVLELKRGDANSLSSMYVAAIRAAAMEESPDQEAISRVATSGVAPLASIQGSIFTVPVTIGGTTYQLVVDTGSSDPWVAASNFTCIDPPTGTVEPQAYCSFGPLYDPTKSSTYAPAPNQNFNVSYADGETLNGLVGYESMTMAGITVPNQQFGIVEQAAWFGDGLSSGLIGLAYSTLTSAYAGNNPSADVKGHQQTYSNLFTSMYQRQLCPPIFSIALSRGNDQGGLMAIGGIPDIPHSPYFASAKIQPVGVNATSGQLVYQFYSIPIDGWAVSASQNAQFNVQGTPNKLKTSLLGVNGSQVIIDSGTSLIYAPNNIVASVAAAFSPPAIYAQAAQAYVVSCSATAPLLGVSIGKKIFYVNPVDLMIPGAGYNLCYLGIQPNFGGLTILGDVWMKSVLAVFDIGAAQMRFAAREFYDTPTCASPGNCPGVV